MSIEDLKAQLNILKSQVEDIVSSFSAQDIIDHLGKEAEEQYEELLDEIYDDVKFGELTFSPSRIIKELDPIAFNIGMSEYFDSLADDVREQVENDDYEYIVGYVDGLKEKLDRISELEEEIERLEE